MSCSNFSPAGERPRFDRAFRIDEIYMQCCTARSADTLGILLSSPLPIPLGLPGSLEDCCVGWPSVEEALLEASEQPRGVGRGLLEDLSLFVPLA